MSRFVRSKLWQKGDDDADDTGVSEEGTGPR